MDKNSVFQGKAHLWQCEISPPAWLKLSGEDALVFAQGQFSADLKRAGESAAVYGLWLNHKGRVCADSVALVSGERELHLFSPYASGPAVRALLEGHIIADDVVVEDLGSEWRGWVVGGDGVSAWIESVAGALPPEGRFVRVGDAWVFRGRRMGAETWEWLAPRGSASPCEVLPAMPPMWLERFRIEAAIPAVPVDIGPADLPNEGGLESVGVSYTKGCYVGQEIMARLKRRGRLRRRLVRVEGSGEIAELAQPQPLFQAGKRVGELRSRVATGPDAFVGLAMVAREGWDCALPISTRADALPTVRLLENP